jgi:hypothetical protein
MVLENSCDHYEQRCLKCSSLNYDWHNCIDCWFLNEQSNEWWKNYCYPKKVSSIIEEDQPEEKGLEVKLKSYTSSKVIIGPEWKIISIFYKKDNWEGKYDEYKVVLNSYKLRYRKVSNYIDVDSEDSTVTYIEKVNCKWFYKKGSKKYSKNLIWLWYSVPEKFIKKVLKYFYI